ncbi:hypothetical protein [Agrococcus casei]|uniref:Lipoprotein n=1 Tax=Agrococcus casei LMG 22410 TaxID=1255656 RepID=A0A1R4GHH3_9MICO|nr:hypothetical protein [Agrococcus casei]SJM67525.1 hypothetical protein CZ674_12020 [Agrococcus casei LMG 22410]
MRRTTTMTTIAALGGTALLLAGCSGGSDASAGTDETGGEAAANVFEFQVNGIEPAEEIAVRVPDDLREAMGSEADGLVLNGFTVRAHDVEGAEFCAAELNLDWADGQPSGFIENNTEDLARAEGEQQLLDATGESSLDSLARTLDEVYSSAGVLGDDYSSIGQDSWDDIRTGLAEKGEGYSIFSEYATVPDTLTGQEMIDTFLDTSAENSGLDESSAVATLLGQDSSDATSIDEFDPNATEEGTFVAADHSSAIVVGDCAASATDPDNAFEVGLGSVDSDGEASSIAEVQLSVMTDGTVGVAGEVEGYMRDANENWIKG